MLSHPGSCRMKILPHNIFISQHLFYFLRVLKRLWPAAEEHLHRTVTHGGDGAFKVTWCVYCPQKSPDLKYSILNSSQNLPPANLCYHPTSSDLLSLRLSDDSRTSSLSQPPKLSQLHKRLGGLGATFQPFVHGLFAFSGSKTSAGHLFFASVLTSVTPGIAAQNPLLSSPTGTSKINTTLLPLVPYLSSHVGFFTASSAWEWGSRRRSFLSQRDCRLVSLASQILRTLESSACLIMSTPTWTSQWAVCPGCWIMWPEGQLWWRTLSLGLSRIINGERNCWWI